MTTRRTDGRARPGEFALIAELFAPLSEGAPGAFDLKDDAAVLAPPPGHEFVLKTDAIVESVHFFRDDPPETVAKKALRVNLSDLAAKGAAPAGYLMALLLPDWPDMTWLAGFARGLAGDQRQFGLSLMGGDTCATPGPLSIAISALGNVPTGAMIRRAGAKPGDLVFVSGTIGDAGAGLAILKNGEGGMLDAESRGALLARYRVPEPRLLLGRALRGLANAAADVSDGLLADLCHIAEVSGVGIAVDGPRIPLSGAYRAFRGADPAAWSSAAVSGDDYEIVFTASPDRREAIADMSLQAGVPVAEIGRVAAGQGVRLLDAGGNVVGVPKAGYVHF